MDEEECETELLEIMFLNGAVYTIKGSYIEEYSEDGVTGYYEESYTVTFKKETVVLPDKAALDAVIAQNG